MLQDPALAFPPPFLYTGYVGFSMAFSFAVAALIDGRIDAADLKLLGVASNIVTVPFRINGADAADFAQGVDCPIGPDSLAPGASCTIYVSFTPHSAGLKSATITIGAFDIDERPAAAAP